jgi:hypothetical protein
MSDKNCIPTANPENECRTCGSAMNPTARLCPTCKAYRQEWRNHLSFWGSVTGVGVVIISALAFIIGEVPKLWVLLFGTDSVQTAYFEYPGVSGFVNTGDGEIVIQSASVTWAPSDPAKPPLEIPINEIVAPGEFKIKEVKSLYTEPDAINGAKWVYRDQPNVVKVVAKDAFDIANPKRCSVFHVYDGENKGFRVIDKLGHSSRLATVETDTYIELTVFHLSSKRTTLEPIPHARTAFLATGDCTAPGTDSTAH